MSRKECSPDHAACEGFFGRLKTEMFYFRDWLSTTVDDFVAALDAYIRCYNEARIKSSLGFRSPAEHRKSWGIAAYPVQVFRRTPRFDARRSTRQQLVDPVHRMVGDALQHLAQIGLGIERR